MQQYFLDANILIQAKNGPYDMEVFPAFWDWIDQMVQGDRVLSSTLVYDEIVQGNDDLAIWVKNRKGLPFFHDPSPNAQSLFSDISDYVIKNYPTRNADPFLDGADPWVIAQAKDIGAIVVTMEKLVPSNSQKVKIPNICEEFGVSYLDTYKMMKELGARF